MTKPLDTVIEDTPLSIYLAVLADCCGGELRLSKEATAHLISWITSSETLLKDYDKLLSTRVGTH
jgi:hypothetical protein